MRFLAPAPMRALTAGQLAQVARRMAELIVEVIDGTLSPLAQRLMQTGLLPAGVTRGDYPFRRSGRVLPQPARGSVLFF
jgi:ethanolamine utilization protein EutA (predicted chaperonin)